MALSAGLLGAAGGAGAAGAGAAGGLSNPLLMALLGAGGGLLGASGPSRMPIGLGQVLGQGLQGGLGGAAGARMLQQEAEDRARQDALQEKLMQLLGFQMGLGGMPAMSGAPPTASPPMMPMGALGVQPPPARSRLPSQPSQLQPGGALGGILSPPAVPGMNRGLY